MLTSLVDIRSLSFVLMTVASGSCLGMLLVWLTRRTYPGFGLWAAGNAALAAALYLLLMRGVISDLFSILLANVFIVGAAVLYYEGTRSFRGWPNHWGTGAALIAVTAATFYYFGIVQDRITARVIVISVILAAVSWLTAWSLICKISHARRLTYWLTGSLFAAYGAFMVVRTVIVACRPDMQDLFAPSILQALTFLVPLLLGILWTFGFFILNSERLEMDLIAQINDRGLAEVALKKSEEEYRLLIETLAIPVLIDIRVKIVYANPAFAELVRASSPEAVIGMRVIDFVPPDLVDTIEERRRILARGERTLRPLDMNLCRLDGTSVAVATRPIPIAFQGQPAVLTALYEITQHKHNEIELQKAHKLLQIDGRNIEDLQTQLKEQSIRDPLTGLFNRRYAEETLPRELARASRENDPVGAAMIDIDGFRIINDTHGPEAGDLVLQALGQFLLRTVRAGDIPCRYGGEEFLLILPRAPVNIMAERADEWRRGIEAIRTVLGAEELKTTVSVGVAVYPEDGKTAEELIHAAELALQRAKALGKNRVVVALTH